MFYFKRNLPVIERWIRVLLGVCAATATAILVTPLGWQAVGYIIAITLVGTAIVGFCPACALLGRKLPENPK